MSRQSPAGARRCPGWRLIALTAGLILLGAGGTLAAQVALFYAHSAHGGQVLLRTTQRVFAQPVRAGVPGCRPPAESTAPVAGVLTVPSLELRAPVAQGSGASQLAVAVGHDPGSVWPGEPGTAVLAGHDVTWFARLGQLHPGDLVSYRATCARYTFRVIGAQVLTAGAALANSSAPTLALITCWPTNALWWTDRRYVVRSVLVRTEVPQGPLPSQLPPPAAAELPAWVTAATSRTPMPPLGQLHILGSPDPRWLQQPAVLADANAVVSLFRVDLADHALPVTDYLTGLTVTLTVHGAELSTAGAQGLVHLAGQRAPELIGFTAVPTATGLSPAGWFQRPATGSG